MKDDGTGEQIFIPGADQGVAADLLRELAERVAVVEWAGSRGALPL